MRQERNSHRMKKEKGQGRETENKNKIQKLKCTDNEPKTEIKESGQEHPEKNIKK